MLTQRDIPLEDLMADPNQPRKTFEPEALKRLADSITARGILMPLRVLRDDERGCWLIVMGESRFKAAKIAGLKSVPCLVMDGQPEEADLLGDRIVENAVRNDLRPLEFGRALVKLKALRGCNSQTLADELGLSGADITRSKALLTLPETIQQMVDDGRVPESAGYDISRLPDEAAQFRLAAALAEGRMTRDQATTFVREQLGKKPSKTQGRLALRLNGGVSLSISRSQPWTWKELLPVIDRLQREAKKLAEGNKEVAELARSMRSS